MPVEQAEGQGREKDGEQGEQTIGEHRHRDATAAAAQGPPGIDATNCIAAGATQQEDVREDSDGDEMKQIDEGDRNPQCPLQNAPAKSRDG